MPTTLRLPGTPAHPAADWRVAAPSLVADVLRGLRGAPKRLSPTYFYDERGSQLFDEICDLPEYYITRTETGILERHAQEIADRIGANALLVEFGSGASTKTRLLLDRLPDLAAYVPVDISRTHLMAAAQRSRHGLSQPGSPARLRRLHPGVRAAETPPDALAGGGVLPRLDHWQFRSPGRHCADEGHAPDRHGSGSERAARLLACRQQRRPGHRLRSRQRPQGPRARPTTTPPG